MTPPKTVKRGDVVTLPNTTSDKSKDTWKSKTLKICTVTKKGSNASPKWRLNGLKKGTCKLRSTASATTRAPALHQNVRIKVK